MTAQHILRTTSTDPYGLLTGGYGVAGFASCTAIGALFAVSLRVVVVFCVVAELAALPLILWVRSMVDTNRDEPITGDNPPGGVVHAR